MGQVANNFGTSIWVLRLHFKLNEKIRTHFWDSLMKVEEYFLCFGSFSIKDGSLMRFYEDKGLGNSTLKETYTY